MHLAYGRIAHLDTLQLANQTFWYAIQIFQYFKTVGFLVNYKRQILSGHNKRLCFVFVFCCLFYWKCSQISQKEFGYISQIICRGETDVDICQKGQIWINFTRLFALLHINFNMLKIISLPFHWSGDIWQGYEFNQIVHNYRMRMATYSYFTEINCSESWWQYMPTAQSGLFFWNP